MLADHVESQPLEQLQIVLHGFLGRGSVETIGPVSLVQSTEHEHKLAIEQGSDNTIHRALGDRAESSVALDGFVAEGDSHIVQFRRLGAPQLRRVNSKVERLVGSSCLVLQNFVAVLDGDLDTAGGI